MIWTNLRQLSFSRPAQIITLCSSLALLSACGGFDWGSDDDDSDNPSSQRPGNDDRPEGNDGGSSIALLSSRDRINDFEVSFDRILNVPDSADVTIDGVTATTDDLQDGMILRMRFESEDNDSIDNQFREPTVTEVNVLHMLVGPITSQNPLRIMGREVIVTEDTYLPSNLLPASFNQLDEDDIRDGVAALEVNTQVRVSGYLNSNNTILATRVEPVSGGTSWQMVGTVEAITGGNTLVTGGVSVNFDGVEATNCNNNEVSQNDLVIITATPSAEFVAEDGLQDIDAIQCSTHLQLPSLAAEDREITSLPAEIEGFITSSNGGSEFFINQQRIRYETLSFTGGRQQDLRVGALAEVEGTYDLDSGILIATNVKFHQRRIYVRAPMNSDNVDTETNTLSVLGIPFNLNGLRITSDNPADEAIASGDITEDTQAIVYGFVDQENNPYLIGVENNGRANFEALELMGPVDDESSIPGDVEVLQVDINLDVNNPTSLSSGNVLYAEDSLVWVTNAERQTSTNSSGTTVFTLDTNDDETTAISQVPTTLFFTEDPATRETRN